MNMRNSVDFPFTYFPFVTHSLTDNVYIGFIPYLCVCVCVCVSEDLTV